MPLRPPFICNFLCYCICLIINWASILNIWHRWPPEARQGWHALHGMGFGEHKVLQARRDWDGKIKDVLQKYVFEI